MAILSLVTGLFVGYGTVLAVHDEEFQLDGNVLDDAADDQDFDWANFFNAAGAESPTLPDASRPGFDASGFDRDFATNANGSFNTSDGSTFSTGSKDTLPITPGWQCGFSSNVNSKTDISNTYAVSYTDPGSNDEILYFGLERNANTGTGNVGFWFLQDAVSCESTSGNEAFVGDHVDGDILVVSEFSNGGAVATIQAYKWEGGANGALNPNPVASGASCATASGGDSVCAMVNTGTITTPWLTANKQDGAAHSLRVSELFEAGLNLTDSGLGGKCFNTFMGVTRSSTSLTATIFDFSLGTLGACTLSMETTPSQTTRVLGSTDPITDTATVTGDVSGGGTAPTPTGTVNFFLCGPADLTPADTGTCQGTSGDAVAGNPVSVSETVAGSAAATSGDASSLITGLGKYCFRAEFTADPADPNYPGATATESNPAEECFTVTGEAAFVTDQDWVPNDSITVSGPAALSGTATFTLYSDATCGTSGGAVVYGPADVAVSGASPQTVSTSNTTAVVEATDGDYSWKVSYDDDTLGDPAESCSETTAIDIVD